LRFYVSICLIFPYAPDVEVKSRLKLREDYVHATEKVKNGALSLLKCEKLKCSLELALII